MLSEPITEASVRQWLNALQLEIVSVDFDRPWGGFVVIDDASTARFIEVFFPGESYDAIANGLALTPKILVVEPGKRLSWQYHHRRKEVWSVVAGPVGVARSMSDEEGPLQSNDVGEVVMFDVQERHRLVGLNGYGVVAEFWKHTDQAYPSDESDIVRVSDDFKRV